MRPDGVEPGPVVRVGFSVVAAANSAIALVWFVAATGVAATARLILFLIFSAIATLAGRMAFSRVRLSREGVFVRNPLRSHRVPWTRFIEFDLGRWGFYPDVGQVRVREGKPISIAALSARGRFGLVGDDVVVPDTVSDLNDIARRMRPTEQDRTDLQR
jgi:hypothetical protein